MEADDYQRWESIRAALNVMTIPAFQTPRLVRLRTQLETQHKLIEKLYMTQSHEVAQLPDGKILTRLREALRKPILDISKDAMLLLEGMPGIADSFRVPHKRLSDDKQLEAADRVLENAKRYEDVFIEGGWDKNFIAKARAAAKALRSKLESGDTVVNRRSAASHAIPGAVAKGRKIVDTIGTAVTTELADDPRARDSWKRAARIPRKKGRPKHNPRRKIFYPPSE